MTESDDEAGDVDGSLETSSGLDLSVELLVSHLLGRRVLPLFFFNMQWLLMSLRTSALGLSTLFDTTNCNPATHKAE